MSRLKPGSSNTITIIQTGKAPRKSRRHSPRRTVATFLLQPTSEDMLEVELVDQPLPDPPAAQFEALLVDSECEV